MLSHHEWVAHESTLLHYGKMMKKQMKKEDMIDDT